MEKISLFLCVIIMILLTSCNTYEYVVPSLGVWQSDNPYIKFDVTDDSGMYDGIYNRDSEEIGVVVVFSNFNNRIRIYNIIIRDEYYPGSTGDYLYFSGKFKFEEDRIIYTLLPHWQAMRGIEEIIFIKGTEE